MAYQIIVKKRFTNKVQKVLTYLEKEWDHRTANEFLLKIDRRFDLLSKQPYKTNYRSYFNIRWFY